MSSSPEQQKPGSPIRGSRGGITGLQDVPVFYPTMEEMRNGFSKYVSYMESQGANEVGLAKVRRYTTRIYPSDFVFATLPPPTPRHSLLWCAICALPPTFLFLLSLLLFFPHITTCHFFLERTLTHARAHTTTHARTYTHDRAGGGASGILCTEGRVCRRRHPSADTN